MPSERMQRQIDRLLNEAEEAIASQDWPAVGDRARSVLSTARAIKIADKLHRGASVANTNSACFKLTPTHQTRLASSTYLGIMQGLI